MKINKYVLMVHAAVLLFGWSGLFANWLTLSAMMIVFGRVFFASGFLMILHIFLKRSLWLGRTRAYIPFIVTGGLLAIHWSSFFHAIQVSSVAIGLITFATFPVFASILEPVFFRERFQKGSLLFAVTAVSGVWFIVPDLELSSAEGLGVFWGFVSAVTFALLSLLNRKFVAERSGMTVGLYQNVFAGFWLLPLMFQQSVMPSGTDLLLLLVLGIVFTGVAHVLFINGLVKVSVRKASLITTMEPVYGIIGAMLVFTEIPSLNEWIGIMIILSTVLLVSFRNV